MLGCFGKGQEDPDPCAGGEANAKQQPVEQEINRSARYNRPIALAVLKPLSPSPETVGRCAALIRKELKAPDSVGHLGNGVFVVVMPETAPDAAQALIGRLVGLLADERVPYRSRMGDSRDFAGGAELLIERLLA